MEFRQELDELLSQVKTVAVISHMRPDTDAFCSVLALGEYIRNSFPELVVNQVFEGEDQGRFSSFPTSDEVEWHEDVTKILNKSEMVIFLDGNGLYRFTDNPDRIELQSFRSVCIDHHEDESIDYNLALIAEDAAATCALLEQEIFNEIELLSPEVTTLLAQGILGDTGGVTYIDAANADVLVSLQRLIEAGNLDLHELKRQYAMFIQNDFEYFRNFIKNTKTADLSGSLPPITYSYLNKDEVPSLNETESGKNQFLALISTRLEGHPWGFIVRYDPEIPTKFKVSFRSSPHGPNVKDICEELFGGGGHPQASAGDYELQEGEGNWDSEQVASKIIQMLNDSPNIG